MRSKSISAEPLPLQALSVECLSEQPILLESRKL
jgi:hypothetical protein